MQLSTTPLEVTYLRTTSLKPDPRNPRVHSDKQVRQIAQSIESFVPKSLRTHAATQLGCRYRGSAENVPL